MMAAHHRDFEPPVAAGAYWLIGKNVTASSAPALVPLGFTLLRRLADGNVHSGEELAASVGMTRARVSQVLKDAESAGLRLERIRGRGYRLLDAPPFLARNEIIAALGTRANDIAIDVVDTVDSTNSELLRRAPRTDIHRKLLVAELQTAGRGRRGRQWTAVAGGSLTFSLGWHFEQGAGFLAGLSLAVGVAVVRGLEAAGFAGIELKWPNDLVHGRRKLGGILIEVSGDSLGPSLTVIGVGVNVALPAAARREIAQSVTDLAALSTKPIDRNTVLASVTASLIDVLERYSRDGFTPFMMEWQRRHALQKKPVQVLLPDGGIARGDVVGVDAHGALVIDQQGRRLRFVTGEVSLRRG
jgi:BirA family transcriptional regulator, biotin operon repressor / biotin---[acetyl-CoA-carboxylase] ligase